MAILESDYLQWCECTWVCSFVRLLCLLDLRFTNNSLWIIVVNLGDVFSILPLCLLGSISNGLNHLCGFSIARSGMESSGIGFAAYSVGDFDFVFLSRHVGNVDAMFWFAGGLYN
ncbi:hypothetical protein K450DRAFT_241202 [Umbelopsis ramanniana AG]|uniref:Uncharacterized protein n=1 Tax=Umbelopsis ramanniana AG TaxID=1314678 RepID=A0AAD5EB95_UMBRA|nr:uncharacterized protein K450DRAFT_241202 [Umbelopsis ramanniana AG]KAI8579725.1 hypothetical protein K450DRAFT_241202 [Umbelopsis ramanniana AG]